MAKKVLVIHGGGFVSGKPSDTRQTARKLRRQGYKVKQAKYTLGQGPKRAYRDIRKIAKEWGADAAVGFSAGGHLASRLASEGRVKKAMAVAPPRKPTWKKTRQNIKRDLGLKLPGRLPGLDFNKESGKVRILHNVHDPWPPYRGSKKLADRRKQVSLSTFRSKQGNPHTNFDRRRMNKIMRRYLK